MTELPPIIERLDALLEGPNAPEVVDYSVRLMAPELCALVLRLQEERDNLEATNNILHRQQLEMMFLRQERDALLEALKGLVEKSPACLNCEGCPYCLIHWKFHPGVYPEGTFEPIEIVTEEQCTWAAARALIASVEGKE